MWIRTLIRVIPEENIEKHKTIRFRLNNRSQAQILSVGVCAKLCLLSIVKILQKTGLDFKMPILEYKDAIF